jgi:hypothetical protein
MDLEKFEPKHTSLYIVSQVFICGNAKLTDTTTLQGAAVSLKTRMHLSNPDPTTVLVFVQQ